MSENVFTCSLLKDLSWQGLCSSKISPLLKDCAYFFSQLQLLQAVAPLGLVSEYLLSLIDFSQPLFLPLWLMH